MQAVAAWRDERVYNLKCIIEEECLARENQLEISARLFPFGGVDFICVNEDIQNMRFFIGSHDFSETPDELFHLSPVSNSMACPVALINTVEKMS